MSTWCFAGQTITSGQERHFLFCKVVQHTIRKLFQIIIMYHGIKNGWSIGTDDIHQTDLVSFLVCADGFKQGYFAGVLSVLAEKHQKFVFDTSGCIGDQSFSFFSVIGVDRFDQSDRACGYQIIIFVAPIVFFCNMGN